jgi:hypothetical protein
MTVLTPKTLRQRLSQAQRDHGVHLWAKLAAGVPVDLGYLPDILLADDPRPVREQLDDRYRHGGGWHEQPPGFKLGPGMILKWPGDPPYPPLAATLIGDELVVFYPHAFLAVFQPDGSFSVTRVD